MSSLLGRHAELRCRGCIIFTPPTAKRRPHITLPWTLLLRLISSHPGRLLWVIQKGRDSREAQSKPARQFSRLRGNTSITHSGEVSTVIPHRTYPHGTHVRVPHFQMETCECQVGNRQGPVERKRGEALCILCCRSHSQLISTEAWALSRPFKQAQLEFQSTSQLVPVPGLRHISGKLAAQCPLITCNLALPTLGRRKGNSELSRPRAVSFPFGSCMYQDKF